MDGDQLGHFSLLEKIGEGGMGRVYKARDTRLERLVAIKLLPEKRLTDQDRRARFFQEARAASALNHPNIITIHEIGEEEGQTFIVMELVEGKPLTTSSRAKACASPMPCASGHKSPTRSPPLTQPASSTATSSPPTSWSTLTAASKSWISA